MRKYVYIKFGEYEICKVPATKIAKDRAVFLMEHDESDFYNWLKFCKFADEKGIGDIDEDWWPWWEFWVAGYCVAMNGG